MNKIVIEFDANDVESCEAAVFKLRRQADMLEQVSKDLRTFRNEVVNAANALDHHTTLPRDAGFDATDAELTRIGYDLRPSMVAAVQELRSRYAT